ncbi:MAG TPA: hypothetical protein VNU46_08530 [Gemmatimonadaceae bacterium]|nr:hypothetical protein [Gemmatimonadaceae bacterium]
MLNASPRLGSNPFTALIKPNVPALVSSFISAGTVSGRAKAR